MNNKSCPSLEAVAQFAASLPEEKNQALAEHIFDCKSCSELLGNMLEDIRCEEACSEECDCREINRFLQDKFGDKNTVPSPLWEKFNQIISDIVNHKTVFTAPRAFAAASSGSGRGMSNASFSSSCYSAPKITMVFGANTDEHDLFYWKASVKLPADANDATLLSINVTDSNEEPISAGELHLFGKTLRIADGFGQISFADFKGGLRTPVAEFTFLCGRTVSGDLKFV